MVVAQKKRLSFAEPKDLLDFPSSIQTDKAIADFPEFAWRQVSIVETAGLSRQAAEILRPQIDIAFGNQQPLRPVVESSRLSGAERQFNTCFIFSGRRVGYRQVDDVIVRQAISFEGCNQTGRVIFISCLKIPATMPKVFVPDNKTQRKLWKRHYSCASR